MDIRSILRAFRFGEMQRRSERDPQAKRPPSIMFLGVAALVVGAGVFMVWNNNQPEASADGGPLDVPDNTASSSPPTSTTTTPSSAAPAPRGPPQVP